MPATEKTWRNQRLMHVVFGVSSLVMLISTVWMFHKDHAREWRQWQLSDRQKERWALEAQLVESNARSRAEIERLEDALRAAQSGGVDQAVIAHFKQLVEAEDKRLAAAGISETPANFTKLDAAATAVPAAAAAALESRQAVTPLRTVVEQAVDAHVAAESEAMAATASADTVADTMRTTLQEELSALEASVAQRQAAEDAAKSARERLLDAMGTFINEANRREKALTVAKKFAAAKHTAIVSQHGLAIGEGAPAARVAQIQAQIDELAASLADLNARVAAANEYRVDLETIRKQVVSQEAALAKELDGVRGELARINDNLYKNTANVGEWITRQPILNAMYDGNVRIDQIWLPDMTINYNFNNVARYDRCTTCHAAIDKTQPGSAVEPAYPPIRPDDREHVLQLPTPAEAPQVQVAKDAQLIPVSLESVYGIILATRGQIDRYDVTIQYVVEASPAARAGLESGDVILSIDKRRVQSPEEVETRLVNNADWGQPIELLIRRGLGQPHTSHPRLDLFVGSLSPHPLGSMGCTICHDGQGSATDFKWASHTPDNPDQAREWSRQHGWFDNHHWIFPMTPHRFVESNCLKCHHDVLELEPSERFPEPPAPKLVAGYNLVSDYGCFGCHEINGYDGPDTRVGPDLRTEPNFYEVAASMLIDPGLSDTERDWARTIIRTPGDDQARHDLYRAVQDDAARAAGQVTNQAGDSESDSTDEPRLAATTHQLSDLLKDVEAPGRLRKAGPSLRYLSAKVDFSWLHSWIQQPSNFRPSTKMPQFFGLHQHLDGQHQNYQYVDETGTTHEVSDTQYTQRLESVEIRALAEFLLDISGKFTQGSEFTYLEPPAEVTEQASVERGKWLFQSRGCLACHSHRDFPGIAANQGPELSRLAAKLDTEKGRPWLYSWLKQPHRYHARTVMPDLQLEPITEVDTAGQPTGQVTDPAADIAAYLLSVPPDWTDEEVSRQWSPAEEKALDDLAMIWLSSALPQKRAERYLREGIPASQAANIKTDERALIGMDPHDPTDRRAKLVEYVARRTITRYGCFGCHDIPTYESAKPIGTALAEWGRKEPGKLAFENIGTFLATHGLDGHEGHASSSPLHDSDSPPQDGAHGNGTHGNGAPAHGADADGHEESGGGHHGLDPLEFDDETGYYVQALNSHQRQGFLWQKLRMPRSYDYEKTRNKRYDERLRMPKFPFDKEQREAVMTFVLGLVNEPPAEKYIFRPDPRSAAIVAGRQIINQYNCGGCHILDMERWDMVFEPDTFEEPAVLPDFPFLQHEVTPERLADSLQVDRTGRMRANVHGMPVLSEETGEPTIVDYDGVPIEPDDDESEPFHEFTLYRDAVVAGEHWTVGSGNLFVPTKRGKYGPADGTAYPLRGGVLAKYLFPHVIQHEHVSNPQAKGSEAWSWLPPPLVGEGGKVQTDWLHGFLMDPHTIRPAAVMRMPNFRMSSDEASKLVNYFAAKDNAQWPYEYNQRRRDGYLAALEQAHPERFDDAMSIVTDGNYCVKCHAVGDYQPKGAIKTQGPQLSDVYQRLRPEYVRNWIANPKRILPYTGMPVNLPYASQPPHFGGVSQDLFPGTSIEQLDALVDLLMNFDEYAKRQTTIRTMVKEAPAEGEQEAAALQPLTGQSAQR